MGKWYWVTVIAVVVAGITAALYFGLEGKTVPYIKWSHFSDAKEVSTAIKTRLSQELQPYQIYFMGPHPEKTMQVQAAENLVQWLRGQGPSVVILDSLMSERISGLETDLKPDLKLDLAREQAKFLEGLKNLDPQKKVIVMAPNIYVTHLLAQSPVSLMHEELQKRKYIVLSFMNFPRSHEEERDFEFPCQTSESSANQLDLGCFVLSQARPFYLKKDVEGKTPGFLNQIRSQEYMMFLGK